MTKNWICGIINPKELEKYKKAGAGDDKRMITTGGIYGIKNYGDENFYYIGKTKNNFYIRWGQHITGIQKGLTTKPGLYWYEFEKDNIDKIDFTILYDCRRAPLENDKDLLELENEFIQKYQPKYNIRGRVKEYNEDKRKRILTDFFKDKDGLLLNREMKERYTQELKERGLSDKANRKGFTFTTVKKYCEELNICSFIEAKANKKDCQTNSKIEYRKNYLRIKLTPTKEKEGGPQNEND